jgi:type I restriction enzyme S subunit
MTVALGHYLVRPPRYGIGAAATAYRADLPTYIRITDIDEFGRFRPDPVVSLDSSLSGNYFLQDGDLVIARTGASVGKSYRYRTSDGELVFAGFLIAVHPDSRRLDPRYLAYLLQAKPYWDWVASESMRSGQPGVNAQQIAQLGLDVPAIGAQRAIVDALQGADDLIDSLERMIAKKRDIKQGMQQELLTGRRRLSGFSDAWATMKLSALGEFLRGRGIKRDDVRPSGVPCIRYGELYTTYMDYTASTVSFVGQAAAATALPIRAGDILFAGSGETKEEIGMSVAYIGEKPAVAGGDIIVLRGTKYDPVYLASFLNTPGFANQKARGGQGDAVVHINWRVLADIDVTVPVLPEQKAIAEVLRDADAEIATLERRLKSARAVKTGMMQELLTGRTRLPVEAAS